MVMHSQTAESLHVLFREMDSSIIELEEIIPLELVAINQIDTGEIHKLMEKRKVLWQKLKNCKSQCQLLFQQHDVPEESELSSFIDMHMAEDAAVLQQQRLELNERIMNISNSNERNAIRLRAAAECIAETLQGLGLMKAKNTYGQDGMM